MKNRERLSGNEYDLLFSMNIGYDRYGCILENIEDSYYYDNKGYRCFGSATGSKCSKCIQEWLNKEENAMTVNGHWYTETEATAYIVTLENKVKKLEDKHLNEWRQISAYDIEVNELRDKLQSDDRQIAFYDDELRQARDLLSQVRSYYGQTESWVDLYEDRYKELMKNG